MTATDSAAPPRGLHHVELWVEDLAVAVDGLGWLLERLGWTVFRDWAVGRSWRLDDVDRHPHAGGPETYAAYLETPDGFEVELVADPADRAAEEQA